MPQVAAVLAQIAGVRAPAPLILTELARAAARLRLLTLPQIRPDLATIAAELPGVGAQFAAILADFVSILPDLSRVLPMIAVAGEHRQ